MGRVKDKVALITGVASPNGMGYATAKLLGSEGAILAVTDISPEVYKRADELKKLDYKVIAFKVDLTKSKDINQMVEDVLKDLGRIDILVNVAGMQPREPGKKRKQTYRRFVDLTEEQWKWGIDINLHTTFNVTKAVFPGMVEQKYGKIVNVSSVTGPIVTIRGSFAYSAAKAAILGLTRALALDGAECNITVNAIGPGWINTGLREGMEDRLGPTIPMKRCGTADDCANLILFLASDESSYITGQMIIIDGGNIIQENKSKE